MKNTYKDEYVTAVGLDTNVITITFSEIEPDIAVFDKDIKLLEDIYAQKKKVILVYESSNAKYLASDLRIKLGMWFKTNKDIIQVYIHHTLFIINSLMIKRVLNGIFLVEKPVYKYDIVSNMEEAQKNVEQKLKTLH